MINQKNLAVALLNRKIGFRGFQAHIYKTLHRPQICLNPSDITITISYRFLFHLLKDIQNLSLTYSLGLCY